MIISNGKNIHTTLNKHTCKHCFFTTLTIKVQVQQFLNHLNCAQGSVHLHKHHIFKHLLNLCSYTCSLRHLTVVLEEVISSTFYLPMSHHWLHRRLGHLLRVLTPSNTCLKTANRANQSPRAILTLFSNLHIYQISCSALARLE